MYYFGTVIEKLVGEDKGVRRAERHHRRRRAAKKHCD
jgi:hypothetical protein